MSRPRPPISDSGKGRSRLPRHVSYEGRQRLSEIAKRRHAEDGGFVAKPGSKPRKKRKGKQDRVAQLVAEAARDKKNAAAIIEVFKDGIHPNQPMTTRLKAAEAWLGIEREEAKIALKEATQESEHRDREELLSILTEKLTSGHTAAMLRRQIEQYGGQVVESTAVDVHDAA
jgi:hypothetical protein